MTLVIPVLAAAQILPDSGQGFGPAGGAEDAGWPAALAQAQTGPEPAAPAQVAEPQNAAAQNVVMQDTMPADTAAAQVPSSEHTSSTDAPSKHAPRKDVAGQNNTVAGMAGRAAGAAESAGAVKPAPAARKQENTAVGLSPFAAMLLGVAGNPAPDAVAKPDAVVKGDGSVADAGKTTAAKLVGNAAANVLGSAVSADKTSAAPGAATPGDGSAGDSVSGDGKAASTPTQEVGVLAAMLTRGKAAMPGAMAAASGVSAATMPDASLGAAPGNLPVSGPGLAEAKPADAAAGANATGLTAKADAPHGAPVVVADTGAAMVAAREVFSVNGKAGQAAGASANVAAVSPASAPAAGLVDASALATPVSGASAVAAPVAPSVAGSVAATPSALAAAVTAMHQAGQASTVLRLDPAGLGALSVHVGLGAQGQVNVLFVPGTAQAAQLLNAGMGDLRHAMAASGLTLGQAQVGGQSNGQSSGQSSGRNTPQPRGEAQNTAAVSGDAAVDTASLVRAYA